MEVKELDLPGVLEIIPKVFYDERGHFFESYNFESFKSQGITTKFVQDNQSFSKAGVVRGLHFQAPPFAQIKDMYRKSLIHSESDKTELNAEITAVCT